MTTEVLEPNELNLTTNYNEEKTEIESTDNVEPDKKQEEKLENALNEFPLVSKKGGRHQLHPFSTTSMLSTQVTNETPEMLLKIEPLDASVNCKDNLSQKNSLEEGTMSDSALSNFPIVTNKPGRHHIQPYTTSSTSDTDVQKSDEPSSSNKRGTLSRMLKNLKGSNKFSQDEKSESVVKDDNETSKQKDVPDQIEGSNTKNSGTIGKMLTKMNNVSKESKTNISKAIHRISDVFSSSSKHKNDDHAAEGKSNMVLTMTAREKCASLSRKVQSLGSHFSKQNISQSSENKPEQKTKVEEDTELEGNKDSSGSLKQNIIEKKSTVIRKISSIGSQLKSKSLQNTGSGEFADVGIESDANTTTTTKPVCEAQQIG